VCHEPKSAHQSQSLQGFLSKTFPSLNIFGSPACKFPGENWLPREAVASNRAWAVFWRSHTVIFRDIAVRHLRDLFSDPGQNIAGLTLKNPIAGSAAQTLNNRDKTCWPSAFLAIRRIGGRIRFAWVITGRHGNSPAIPPFPGIILVGNGFILNLSTVSRKWAFQLRTTISASTCPTSMLRWWMLG